MRGWAPSRQETRPLRRAARSVALAALSMALASCLGCAGSRREPQASPRFASEPAVAVPQDGQAAAAPGSAGSAPVAEDDSPQGVFHRVEAGQTLWRIARVYGVSQEELARVNGLEDPTRLHVGSEVFVPGATSVMVVPPYPSPLPLVPVPAPRALSSPLGASDFEWPVPGGRVLSYFGARRRTHRHAGLDLGGEHGQEILAARAGVVTFSGRTRTGYGNLVILDHGGGLESLYAHDKTLLVSVGDRVEKGQAIALVGRTGNATTPHCHFEIRKDRVAVDPIPYLSRLAEARP